MQRVREEHGEDGGDADPESAAGLPGGEGRASDLCEPVAGQARRRRQDLVEGQRRGQADLREEDQPAEPLLLPLHRSSSHWEEEKVSVVTGRC